MHRFDHIQDAVMKVQVDVTDALRRTMKLILSELEWFVLSTQIVVECASAS
jgi:hypothetical protein